MAQKAKRHVLTLECGHTVERRVRYRYTNQGERREDPAPDWVYCEECQLEETIKSLLGISHPLKFGVIACPE